MTGNGDERTADAATDRPDWKERARAEFELWLAAQSDHGPEQRNDGMAEVGISADLLTVIGELTALKQEVRGMGRSSARLAASTKQAAERMGDDLHRATEDIRSAGREAIARALLDCEKPLLMELGDIRAALDEIVKREPVLRGRWPWRGRIAQTVLEHRDALLVLTRRIDSVLARHNVKPFGKPGDPFDGNRMTVTDVSRSGTVPDGAVSAVVRIGYVKDGTVLRSAEVIVEKEDRK